MVVMEVMEEVRPERIMRSTPSITHGQDKKAIQQHYEHLQTLLQCLRQYLDDLKANAFISHTQVYFPIESCPLVFQARHLDCTFVTLRFGPPINLMHFQRTVNRLKITMEILDCTANPTKTDCISKNKKNLLSIFFCILDILPRGLIALFGVNKNLTDFWIL